VSGALVMDDVEVIVLHPGPDDLTRITARRSDEINGRSCLLLSAEADDAVLDEWAELHDAVLGFPPNW
jgi:hypothetical protein